SPARPGAAATPPRVARSLRKRPPAAREAGQLHGSADRERLPQPETGRPSRFFAWLVVTLGVLVGPRVVLAATFCPSSLPAISSLPAAGVGALLPTGTAAGHAEQEA